MDSHNQIVDSAGTCSSYSSSPSSSSLPIRFLNSPNSPFSTLSDSQELHSSQELSSFTSLEANSYIPRITQPSTTPNHPRGDTWLLQQLESLMTPVDDEGAALLHPQKRYKTNEHHPQKRHKTNEHGELKNLLISCANALDQNDYESFYNLVSAARSAVSTTGEPVQRLGAYLIEGLIARKNASGVNICRSLKRTKETPSFMQMLYEFCPYLKFGYMAANGAIADACKDESRIHIIDFQIGQCTQWITLLRALAARPGGTPRVRITGIDDPTPAYPLGDGLETASKRLNAVSSKFRIPVEFHRVSVPVPRLNKEILGVRNGEALVVNFPLQLHRTADESVDVDNPRDGVLRLVRSLNPKVTTLIEQESNTNTAPFRTRFAEAYEYYLAMFESVDASMSREVNDRVVVEQQCLAWDIVNVIACEGRERGERHELFGKWKSRFTMAGFRPYPLSTFVNTVIRRLLRCYSDAYTLEERDGALLLGWKHRNLISASAWR